MTIEAAQPQICSCFWNSETGYFEPCAFHEWRYLSYLKTIREMDERKGEAAK